eukprot:7769565-Alexandrium_andersonii.AAC.1
MVNHPPANERVAVLHMRFCRCDGSTRLLDDSDTGQLATCLSVSVPLLTDLGAAHHWSDDTCLPIEGR